MASECAAPHKIEVANLSDGELVGHSILLVRGRVRPRCTRQEHITLEHCGTGPEQRRSSPAAEAQLSSTGEFKLLVDLRPNVDREGHAVRRTLLLRHCNAAHQVEIVVRARQPDAGYALQPLYILCQDEAAEQEQEQEEVEVEEQVPPESALAIVDLNLRLVQCVYADKLRAAGFGRLTFTLHGGCRIFRSRLTRAEAWQLPEDALWQHFAAELLNSEWSAAARQLKFVAFIGCTKYDGAAVAASGDYSYANIRRHLRAHAALGGGGLALFGSAFFYAWPRHLAEVVECFRSGTPVDRALRPDDSNYRRTHGGVYATTLGAICHELGHTFDLGHTVDGVMGNGFDYLNRVFTSDSRTEDLPDRVLLKSGPPPVQPPARPRLTPLRKPASSFLAKYHEQRQSDCFFFSRSCAVILAHHKWLRPCAATDTPADIVLHRDERTIVSSEGQPLRLIEVRTKENSLVEEFYEFGGEQGEQPVRRYRLPATVVGRLFEQQSHYLFVLTVDGTTKRLLID